MSLYQLYQNINHIKKGKHPGIHPAEYVRLRTHKICDLEYVRSRTHKLCDLEYVRTRHINYVILEHVS